MQDVELPKNDFGYNVAFAIKDSSGTVAYNLTDYLVTLKAWSPHIPDTLITSGTCSILNASAGSVTYTIGSAVFTTIASYRAEIELTKAGVRESTQPFLINITESG